MVSVTVLMPAYMEAARIADSVRAACAIPGVTRVLVIDDGSADDTAMRARQAGAEVLRLADNVGKGAALRAGLAACPGAEEDIFLLLDADLGQCAAEGQHLLTPVVAGVADLTIARFPKVVGKAGFGLVKGLARWGTWALTRQWLAAPISGRRWVLTAAPLAVDYGLEVAMNTVAGDVGARVCEVPVQMTHQVTGRDLRGFQHRGRQFAQIFAALCAAAFGRTGQRLLEPRVQVGRVLLWLAAILAAGDLIWHSGSLLPVVVAAVIGLPLAALASGVFRARRLNFRRCYIPALGGLMLFPGVLVFAFRHGRLGSVPPWLAGALLMWMLLGLFDDVAGSGSRRGFRGHLTSLWHGQLTTGAVKLLAGGVLALGMAYCLPQRGWALWITIPLAACLIALSANAINLFDLRPGRALKICWLVLLPLIGCDIAPAGHMPPLSSALLTLATCLLCITLLYAPLDFAGMMMLGDTGANVLGAFLGLYLAATLPLYGQCFALLLLVALHLYAERASITRMIERVVWLNWLDQLGRS
jgi:glycosyltransferase involved in cell wall biosynthesis